MWLFTDFGFFSVVVHRERAGTLLVRARVRSDLEALRQRLPRAPKIITNADADYRYRMLVPAEAFAAVVSEAVRSIDYDNFKDAVAERQGQDRAHAYLDVWARLRQMEKDDG